MNYTTIDPAFTKHFFQLVGNAKNIVIAGHVAPDGDSIGSVLAIYHIILQKFPGKNVRMLYTGEQQPKYKDFQNFDKIEFMPDIANTTGPDDLLIVVDGSQFYRFSYKPEVLQTVKQTICIDHHASPIDNFTLSLIIPGYIANGEVIYRAFKNDITIDKPLAEILLLAILTDSGNFAYLESTQYSALQAGKELLDIAQVQMPEFQSRYTTITEAQFAISQELVKNTTFVTVDGWSNVHYSFLSQDFVDQGKYSDNDISEGANVYVETYLNRIHGRPWGFVVTPRKSDNVRISARSLPGSVNVRDFLERIGFGGGHDRAAGGKRKTGSPEDCVQTILEWLKNNKPVLS